MIDSLKKKFFHAILEAHSHYGNETVMVDRSSIFEVLQFLKENEECPFNMLLDVCGVDYIGQEPRFEVVYHLYSLSKKARLRVRVKVPESDPQIKSVVCIWGAANWFEREAFEMFGIRFEGHPNLKKLLLWEDFQGHPLRKDYPIDKRQNIPEQSDIV